MKMKKPNPPTTMNTKKILFGLFAISMILGASCTSNSSDDLYDGVDKRYVTKDNKGVDKRFVTKDNKGASNSTDSVDKRYVTTGN